MHAYIYYIKLCVYIYIKHTHTQFTKIKKTTNNSDFSFDPPDIIGITQSDHYHQEMSLNTITDLVDDVQQLCKDVATFPRVNWSVIEGSGLENKLSPKSEKRCLNNQHSLKQLSTMVERHIL